MTKLLAGLLLALSVAQPAWAQFDKVLKGLGGITGGGGLNDAKTDGLFYVVAQEEKKIRTNPAARVNDLLKEVFGSRK